MIDLFMRPIVLKYIETSDITIVHISKVIFDYLYPIVDLEALKVLLKLMLRSSKLRPIVNAGRLAHVTK